MPLAAGTVALEAFIVVLMVLSLVVLGVICWIFWRAKQREDAELQAKQRE